MSDNHSTSSAESVVPTPLPPVEPVKPEVPTTQPETHNQMPPAVIAAPSTSADDSIADLDTMPALENLYSFGMSATDRDRLIAQGLIFSQYLRENMQKNLRISKVTDILEIGCGEGQVSRAIGKIYPSARIVAEDKDPKAIEKAKRDTMALPGQVPIEFGVADANESLPGGPFDVIYTSLTLMYVQNIEKALTLMFNALRPGGFIWIKETNPDWLTVFKDNAIYTRYETLASVAFMRAGMHMFLGPELVQVLPQVGFVNVRNVEQREPIRQDTTNGRIVTSIMLGALYNVRKLIARFDLASEEDLLKMHAQLCAQVDTLHGQWIFSNVIGQRPPEATPEK